MCGEKNEILFETNFYIEEKEGLVRSSLIKVAIHSKKMISFGLFRDRVVVPYDEILVQRIYLQLDFLVLFNYQLHLQDRFQVKYVKDLQELSCLN